MKILKSLSLATIAAILLISNSANANTTPEEFVQKASMSNLFEIESSKLVNEKSQNTSIKEFADHMISDHGNVGTELESTVSTANLDSSLVAKSLDKKHQDIINKLQKASGKDFDKKYVNEQVDAHKDAVKLFRDYSKNGTNADLKAFADKNLPNLEDHLKQIKDIKSSM
jgi:putative membrane protein